MSRVSGTALFKKIVWSFFSPFPHAGHVGLLWIIITRDDRWGL